MEILLRRGVLLQCSYVFFQKLSGSHKALVEMQDDVSELLRSAIREYKQTKVRFQPHQHTF